MIAARQPADVATAHRIADVAAQQHRRDQPDLVDVVALLPPADLPPRDLRRRVEHVEGVGGDPAPAELVRRDAEVTQLELLVLAHEHVEWREVAVERVAAMQRVQRSQNRNDLAPNESFALWPLLRQPGTEV